jgi:hypothetical protein
MCDAARKAVGTPYPAYGQGHFPALASATMAPRTASKGDAMGGMSGLTDSRVVFCRAHSGQTMRFISCR